MKVFCIDDDKVNHFIAERYIKSVLVNPQISTFTSSQDAINELLSIKGSHSTELPDYILLDLNMPFMDGWDFLDEFNRLKIDPRGKIKIYIITSSVSIDDIDRSKLYTNVREFVSKPLSRDKLKNIFKVRQ